MKQKFPDPYPREQAEHQFAELIAKKTRLYLVRSPETYAIDYALIDRISGDMEAWLDVSCQEGSPGNEFQVGLNTWMNGLELIRQTNKAFLIGFRYDHFDYLLQLHNDNIPLSLVEELPPVDNDKEARSIKHTSDKTRLNTRSLLKKPLHNMPLRQKHVVRIPKKLFQTLPDE